ncbi:MAG TPA: TetR/AcrR family transcriptional regulator [Capsulimonadaceae bacterium]
METVRKESAARRKILDTASRLFYQHGIRATGIDAVIEQADVARMTLYKHFPSKEALVDAVLREAGGQICESMASIFEDETLSPKDRILAIFDWQARILTSPEFRGCPFMNAVAESPERDSLSFGTAVAHKQKLQASIEHCVEGLAIAEPELLTEQLVTLMDGASVRAQLGFGEAATKAARAAAERLIEAAR